MNITVKLYKSEMMFAVKNDTHIIAQGLFNNDVKAKASFGVQVDNDADVKKMMRSMQSGAQEVKNIISNFIQTTSASTANNAQLTMSNDNDAITLTLSVSDRFNTAFLEPLTIHCHNYIVNRMLRDWFLATRKELAADYAALMEQASQNIQSSFFKLPPTAPVITD